MQEQDERHHSRATGIIVNSRTAAPMGKLPPHSVVVSGASRASPCAMIDKRVDDKTRSKTAINELLRD
jgi:2,3,4,5-tetrahydropyridine-2-carboxylate N-succinyltransferase